MYFKRILSFSPWTMRLCCDSPLCNLNVVWPFCRSLCYVFPLWFGLSLSRCELNHLALRECCSNARDVFSYYVFLMFPAWCLDWDFEFSGPSILTVRRQFKGIVAAYDPIGPHTYWLVHILTLEHYKKKSEDLSFKRRI